MCLVFTRKRKIKADFDRIYKQELHMEIKNNCDGTTFSLLADRIMRQLTGWCAQIRLYICTKCSGSSRLSNKQLIVVSRVSFA
jgi:hypothetical protein